MAPKTNKNNKKQAIVRIDGRGNYYTEKVAPVMQQIIPKGTFSRGGKFLGEAGGSLFGGRYGGPSGSRLGGSLGGKAGGSLGSGLSRILGFGDYQVTSNSLVKEGMAIAPGESVPAFGVIGHGTTVRHREFIGDVVVPSSPTDFTNIEYRINPGNSTTFPWLASLAANYQQYRFEGLVFEFKTLSSDITSGGALGSLILATNYDVNEPKYVDKLHMENSQYAVSAKPSVSQIHTIECDPQATPQHLWYVKDSSSGTGDDRFFDLGKFQLATAGLPGTAGQVLGELWASYEVTLFKPEIVDPGLSSKTIGFSSITKSAIFGTAPAHVGRSIFNIVDSTLTFTRADDYLLVLNLTGTGANVLTVSGTATSSILWQDVSASTLTATYVVRIQPQVGQTVVLDSTAWTTVTASELRTTLYTYTNA